MDIVLSAQTSIKHTLKNMLSGVHLEDLNFFSKLKEYIVNGKINPINIKKTLMNLEDQKQLPTNTVSNLLELDRHFNTKVF